MGDCLKCKYSDIWSDYFYADFISNRLRII